jgi:hypothetical protein
MRAKSPKRQSIWRRGLVLAAFTLIAGLCLSWIATSDWLSEVPPVGIRQLSDSQLADHLRALVREGPAELARVVESLVAERSALQSAAARALHEEIERSAKLAADEAGDRLDQIARLLASYAPQSDDGALAAAAAMAERILAIPQRRANNTDRLRNCHIVLKEKAERRIKEQSRSPDRKPKHARTEPTQRPAESARPADTVTLAPLPGGGLMATPSDSIPRRLPRQAERQAKPLGTPANNWLGAAPTSRRQLPSQANLVSGAAGASANMESRGRDNRNHAANEGKLPDASEPGGQPATATARPMPRDLARLIEASQLFGFGSRPESAALRAEIASMGFDETQLKLARAAVDHDPRVRIEVIEALPTIGNVDVRGWLLWLSHDRDPDVRRAAVALLATASDPELRKRVRDAADNDSDPRVRQQAQAALKARS